MHTISEIAKTNNLEFKIFAVDDCSTDNSHAILERLSKDFPIETARHEQNQGPGGAFRTGFNEILKRHNEGDFIITMDADNTHSVRTVGMIVSALEEGYELVIASVFAPGGMLIGVPFLRWVLTMGCNFLYRILFPVRGIREYTGFYRGYRAESLASAKKKLGGSLFLNNGFGAMAELLVRLRTIPVFMKEVPMLVRYDQKGGKSKMKILLTIEEHLKIIASNVIQRRVL